MRTFLGTILRTLASVSLKVKLSSSWGERWDSGWLVEVFDLDIDYLKEADYSIEESHFPDTRGPFIWDHKLSPTFTILNFSLDIILGWETES